MLLRLLSYGGAVMAAEARTLSSRSAAILKLIAEGHSYEQVLATDSALTYLDIFAAAREALAVASQAHGAYAARLEAVQEQYPRAYAPWTSDEEEQLRQLVAAGQSVNEISARLQRQPSAIRSRLQKLRLSGELSSASGQALHNVTEFYGRGRAGWDGTDAQEYVNRLREEWDHRP